jgi:DNA-binding transcriptional regulator YiaG
MTPAELHTLRTETLGLTAQRLADALGVHRRTIHKWESGERVISTPIATLIRMIAEQHPVK